MKVNLNKEGCMDLEHLREILNESKNYSKIIVCMSAGSNVSGVKTDVPAVCKLAKQ